MIEHWKHSYASYEKAIAKLSTAAEYLATGQANELEIEGFIKRFEYTWELAWKLLKDYMEEEGLEVDAVSPRQVVRTAFAAGIITEPEVYFDMIEARNMMSHTYSFERFERVLASITTSFIPKLLLLHEFFKAK